MKIALHTRTAQRTRMYKRNDCQPGATAESRAPAATVMADCFIQIDLDKLTRYFDKAVLSKAGRARLAHGGIVFVATNRTEKPVPKPAWAQPD